MVASPHSRRGIISDGHAVGHHAAVEDVASEQGKALKPLTDDLVLLDSGLDSLCFAVLVTRLEDEVGFDPFTLSDDVYFPVTLGDFIRFYDDAARQPRRSDAGCLRRAPGRGGRSTPPATASPSTGSATRRRSGPCAARWRAAPSSSPRARSSPPASP